MVSARFHTVRWVFKAELPFGNLITLGIFAKNDIVQNLRALVGLVAKLDKIWSQYGPKMMLTWPKK